MRRVITDDGWFEDDDDFRPCDLCSVCEGCFDCPYAIEDTIKRAQKHLEVYGW